MNIAHSTSSQHELTAASSQNELTARAHSTSGCSLLHSGLLGQKSSSGSGSHVRARRRAAGRFICLQRRGGDGGARARATTRHTHAERAWGTGATVGSSQSGRLHAAHGREDSTWHLAYTPRAVVRRGAAPHCGRGAPPTRWARPTAWTAWTLQQDRGVTYHPDRHYDLLLQYLSTFHVGGRLSYFP